MYNNEQNHCITYIQNGQPVPSLMTEAEVIDFLRIPEVSKARNHSNVITNLKRMRELPCIYICRQPLYPLDAIRDWIEQQVKKEHRR
jgi:hypothetical protein